MNVLVSEAFFRQSYNYGFVLTPGNGNLLYQLDQGAYQQSNVFIKLKKDCMQYMLLIKKVVQT